MRLYAFTNMYLSPLQQGLQTAHLVHELFNKYSDKNSAEYNNLNEWSKNHKTIIILNGGNQAKLETIKKEIELLEYCTTYPNTFFREDKDSLNEALTCVGIILPDTIYDNERYHSLYSERKNIFKFFNIDNTIMTQSSEDYKFYELIKSRPLA